ncbi:MAG: hypothetical protein JSS02_11540 [Planctomycetes bacterium]|nr:hypothetical protein [Planctomycetota bacterium]
MHGLLLSLLLVPTAGRYSALPDQAESVPAATAGRVAEKASDESRESVETEVRRLIGDLSAPTRTRRIDAEKRLLELGPQVLPYFPAPELLPSNSVREAVRRMRVELERRRANESIQPARVTVDGSHTVAEVLDEIGRQTGNLLDSSSLPAELLQRRYDVELREATFWQAVADLSKRFDLANETDTTFKRLKLLPMFTQRNPPLAALSQAGVFRLEVATARQMPRIRSVTLRQTDPQRDLLRFQLRVRPEPRLRALFLQFAANEVDALTAEGTRLQPLSADANYDLPFAEGPTPATFQLDYLLPAGQDLRRPMQMRGKMRCTTAAGHELFRFPRVTEGAVTEQGVVARRRGGVTVSLVRTAVVERSLRVRISVVYDQGGPAFESHRTWFLNNDVYLEDAAGQRLPPRGGSDTLQQGDGTVGIEFTFTDLPDPLPAYTFVYSAPTLIIDVPFEFQIESVPVDPRSLSGKATR